MKKIIILGRRLLRWLRDGFVLSKTVIFILGLAFSYALVKKAVVDVLEEFITDAPHNPMEATVLVNLLDVISAVFKVGVTHVSQAYTCRFNVIIFCAGAYAMGLTLLWIHAWDPSDHGTLIFAIVLIAFGMAGQEPTLIDFFNYQLKEKLKKKCTENDKGEDKESSEEKEITFLWWPFATTLGSVIAVLFLGGLDYWWETFQVSSYFMGATYLVFFSGIFCYYPEERRPPGSPLPTIYRVLKEAFKKRTWKYPPSKEGYYSNSNNEDSNDLEDPFDQRENNGEVNLLPDDPSFLLRLYKAAIRNNLNAKSEERTNEEVCTVEQVEKVKSLYPIIPWGFMLFAYSLVSASGNTYFVQQASNLDPYVFDFHVPLAFLFVLQSLAAFVVRTIQSTKKRVKPIRSIAVGMFCSVLCGIAAWLVERQRLYLTIKNPQEEYISLSIMVLAPQYLLLGLMVGFAEDGLVAFVEGRAHESMKTFVEPFTELLLAMQKLWSLFFAFCFGVLTNKSVNDSLLDWYFLFLALLSFGFFCIYVGVMTTDPVETSGEAQDGEASNQMEMGQAHDTAHDRKLHRSNAIRRSFKKQTQYAEARGN